MSHHYPQYPDAIHAPSPRDEDVKIPFDDFSDSHGNPRTFAVDPSALATHGRQPSSYTLSNQSHETSKDFKSAEGFARHPVDWEYPPTLPKDKAAVSVEKESKWSKYIPDSLACRLYLLTVLVETAIDLAIEGDIILRFHEAGSANSQDLVKKRMPVYLSIFAFAHVFQFAMALDAVWARNTLQFISLAIFNALFLLYAIIQISEINEAAVDADGISNISIQTLAIIIPVVISVAEVAYIALGWKIYTEFGWKVYKFLGADRRIKTIFTNHQIFLCLVKFDLFFWVGFSVQFIFLVLSSHNLEFYLTCAALPLSIIVLVEGHLAARHESKPMMLAFMAGCGGAMLYFVYKLQKVVRFHDTEAYRDVWKTLSTFSAFAIILLLVTIIFAVLVMSNFGRGLKEQIERNKHKKGLSRANTQYVHRGPMATHPNRMSIN
ncbi:uncharacterized protein BXZ73DRAFT_51602 [Epithele typhae]|uniref:uncharacterized protein n=1 Tax=Epithele typhae TaxID=378194 RepID=UPI0020076B8E|nr:uncharacterized protein BXZ73DRAFT_51602 [Epithele typhae]KAH9921972.1 hypothetical protein BXZ73DRAFT_51602 [Epithele typhae]